MHFSAPAALLLLLILIPIIILGWPDRRAGRRRAILSLALRSSLFILVVLALAGLEFLSPLRGVWTVFVLDRSDSIQPLENERALEYIDSSLAAMQIDDRAIHGFCAG